MRSVFSLALPLLASASPMLGVQTIHNDAAPILSSVSAETIPDRYLIVFKDHVSAEDASAHHSWVQDVHTASENSKTDLRKRSLFFGDVFEGLRSTFDIGESFKGYAGHFDEDILEQIRRHPDVSHVQSTPHVLYANSCNLG